VDEIRSFEDLIVWQKAHQFFWTWSEISTLLIEAWQHV